MSDATSTRRVLYSGRVQGVGFRYTCASIAKRYPVGGYVKNLANGSVELVVSGVSGPVDKFLAEIAKAFTGNIESCMSDKFELAEPVSGFHIRR